MDWCCCFRQSSTEERAPLFGESQAVSARQVHPSSRAVNHPVGKIVARHVGVRDVDQCFADITETFNEQHERYQCMKDKLGTLMLRYVRAPDGSLSECLDKIKAEHDTHRVQLQVKGCYFSLVVTPADDVPDKLKLTQEDVVELSRTTTAVDSSYTKLQPMIDSYLKDREGLTARVGEAAQTHQERQRLQGNLRANLQEARRAKELSSRYREEARKLLSEAALLSGATL